MKLAYREIGQGLPLIILHGLFGQSDNWNSLAKQFAEKGYRVFALDLRNHGLSPHSEEWNYEVMAGDINEFIQEHNLEQPILLGHSMGAKVVLFFELLFPQVASKIIIADMAVRAYEPHHNKVFEALHAVDFSIIKNRKEAETIMSNYISDFGTKQFLLKNIYWKDTENSILDWRFNLDIITKNYWQINVEVPVFISTTPTLILRGGNSNYVIEKDVIDFKTRFLDCMIETIEGAGHWLHAEKPKEFFKLVIDFILYKI